MVWYDYLTTKYSTMKKLSVLVFHIFFLSSLGWAEKYEFVILKMTHSGAKDSSTGHYHGDSVELKSGDVAKVVALEKDAAATIFLWDGEEYIRYDTDESGLPSPSYFVGPGTLILADYYATSGESVTIGIQRASETGSTTLAWNGSTWQGSTNTQQGSNTNNNSPVSNPSNIKYDELLGWVWFTDTPWVYSYTNGTWYYLHSMPDGIYVWNANLPNNGWMKLHG